MPDRQLSFLIALGNTHLLQFHYVEAFSYYEEARRLAERLHDWESLAITANNLSSAYLAVGDFEAALGVTRESLRSYRQWQNSGHGADEEFLAPLELQYVRLRIVLEPDGGWEPQIYRAIELARLHLDRSPLVQPGTSDTRLEAQAWDVLGELRLQHLDINGAEQAIDEAYRLRLLHAPRQLFSSYLRLAELRLAQAQADSARRAKLLDEAQLFNDKYRDAVSERRSTLSEHMILHQRGRIRLAQGNITGAIADFARAADLAERWRAGVMPASSSLIAIDRAMQDRVYDDYIETAAAQAIRQHDDRLMRESLLANERTRAESLRRSMHLSEVWREKLPNEYWDTLGRLRMEASRQATSKEELSRLELEIARMEAAAGIGEAMRSAEPLPDLTALRRVQASLRTSELLLSFHVGQTSSYLWAISNNRLRLYPLAGEQTIANGIVRFLDAIASDNRERILQEGSALYACLFGKLEPAERERANWLISAEGPLFDVPFAALVSSDDSGLSHRPKYLMEQHSVQIVPGAFLFQPKDRSAQSRSYLGVGDPVYNLADPRLEGIRPKPGPATGQNGVPGPALTRLIATGREVREGAGIWRVNAEADANVLEGREASRQRFLDELSLRHPGVIHLATHVFQSTSQAEESFIAFSLGENGRPELLGTSDIGLLEAPGALVVMTGCSSAGGEVRPGAGLLGLIRAWLLAGAADVLATQWPVRDRNSSMIAEFYRQLNQTDSAAQALRRSQLAMLQTGGWEASPSHWASYQITGGAR